MLLCSLKSRRFYPRRIHGVARIENVKKKQEILWKARMVQCEYVQMMCVRNQRAKNTKIGCSVVVEKATPKNLNEM